MGLLKKQDVGREELMPCSLPEQLSSQEPRTELGAESVSGAGCVLTISGGRCMWDWARARPELDGAKLLVCPCCECRVLLGRRVKGPSPQG